MAKKITYKNAEWPETLPLFPEDMEINKFYALVKKKSGRKNFKKITQLDLLRAFGDIRKENK